MTSAGTGTSAVRIDGRKVVLREFALSDLHDTMAVVGDDQVTRWLSFASKTLDQQRELLAGVLERATQVPRSEYYLAIEERAEERLVGFVRLGLTGAQAAKLGYAVRHDAQKKGFATDAAQAMIDFGFGTLKLHRITAAIGPDNIASHYVAAKLGMTLEGRLRDHVFTNGAWRDSDLYSILHDEWQAGWHDR